MSQSIPQQRKKETWINGVGKINTTTADEKQNDSAATIKGAQSVYDRSGSVVARRVFL